MSAQMLRGLAQNIRSVEQSANIAASDLEKAATALDKLNESIGQLCKGLDQHAGDVSLRPASNRAELRNDIIRIGVLVAAIIIAWRFPMWITGWLPVVIAIVYVVAILAAVAIRNDHTYKWHGKPLKDSSLGQWSYHILPSFLGAIPVAAGIFIAVWVGFAVLLSSADTTNTLLNESSAYASSFLTLATFEGPSHHFPQHLRSLVFFELVCAILVVVGVLGLLINRLSNFDSRR